MEQQDEGQDEERGARGVSETGPSGHLLPFNCNAIHSMSQKPRDFLSLDSSRPLAHLFSLIGANCTQTSRVVHRRPNIRRGRGGFQKEQKSPSAASRSRDEIFLSRDPTQ